MIRKTDKLWTAYMRKRYNYTCQYCFKQYTPDNCSNLGVSHFHSRSHESVRFDIENTVLLCSVPCHSFLDSHKDLYKDFMLKRLGQERYDKLELRANEYKKRNDVETEVEIKKL